MANINLRICLWIGSNRKASIIPIKIGRRICDKVVKKARTEAALKIRKNSKIAAVTTQKAVTPAAINGPYFSLFKPAHPLSS